MWNANYSGTTIPSERPSRQYTRRPEVLTSILRSRLPTAWTVTVEDPAMLQGPDAMIELVAPDGREATLMIKVATQAEPRDVPSIASSLRRFGEHGHFLVAPFLSERTQDKLRSARIGYGDLTGNLHLSLERPALFLRDVGARSDPWREERGIHSLKGPTAGRVVRALCDFQPPYGIRELASRSNTSPASVSRVVALLDRESLVTRDGRGRVVTVDWPGVIRRWAEDYSFSSSNRTYAYLEPRGLPSLLSRLDAHRIFLSPYVITSSFAAAAVAPIAPARLLSLYVNDVPRLAGDMGLLPAEIGANVLMAEPSDPVVFDRTWTQENLVYAALSQTAADLLTGPGRQPNEGQELLKWMEEHVDAWRQ